MSDSHSQIFDILVVDDEPLILLMAQVMLEDAGYRVTAAASAEEALSVVDGGFRPAALVTDHSLPGMSGVNLANRLNETIGLDAVLIVTGHGNAQLGWPILAKPYRDSDLVGRVDALLGRNGQ